LIYFWIGLAVGIGVELFGRMSQMSSEEPGEPEAQPVSVSNGTIFKTLAGVGILGWLFRRKK
jgi:hypothetical protein